MYDNSQLQQFKNCPESYRLKYIEGLRKREEGIDEHDKVFGQAVHAGLEEFYKGGSEAASVEAFRVEYPIQLNGEDQAKTQANGETLLKAYFKHYKEEDRKWSIKAVEVTDTFEIAPGIPFTVKIDLVIEQQGCIYFVDHKTTGKAFNWTYWSQFEPNSQITAYVAYCQSKFGECSGGIINGLQLGYRTRKYLDQPAGFHYSFQRQLFNRNQDQVKAWKDDSVRWIEKLKYENTTTLSYEPWTKNEGQCRYCSFKEVCISCADQQIIEQLYEKVDPKKYLNVGSQKEREQAC